MNTVQNIIERETAAESELIPVIERIMREDIFHGPLDWQTAEQLRDAAREAVQIYYSDKDFHDADTQHRKARWARIVAEKELAEEPDNECLRRTLAAAFEAERNAVTHLESFYSKSP